MNQSTIEFKEKVICETIRKDYQNLIILESDDPKWLYRLARSLRRAHNFYTRANRLKRSKHEKFARKLAKTGAHSVKLARVRLKLDSL